MLNAKINCSTVFLLVLLCLFFPVVEAESGVFDDIRFWYKERSEINQHSRVISNEVKALYRDRKSIQNFAEGASGLVKAYHAISNKNSKASLPQLIEIARSITLVVSEFNNLAPKAEAMYRNSKPSMAYFSQLADQTETIKTAKSSIAVKSFSNSRLNKIAGANGWNRVFDAVKSDPMNIFRWGRLKDEYKLGKLEAQYPLKCAQIAFEAYACYVASRDSVMELISIQKEIEGIMGGNLGAILNIAGTVNKIQNAGNSIETVGELANTGVARLGIRFAELIMIQQQYVAANKAYNEKYNKASPGASGNSSTPAVTAVSSGQKTERTANTGTASNAANSSIETAMAEYQKAYEAYVAVSQKNNASQSEINRAISNLNAAKKKVEAAKTH